MKRDISDNPTLNVPEAFKQKYLINLADHPYLPTSIFEDQNSMNNP
jgi:hypothetical protein